MSKTKKLPVKGGFFAGDLKSIKRLIDSLFSRIFSFPSICTLPADKNGLLKG
jgi:hypothetical protein